MELGAGELLNRNFVESRALGDSAAASKTKARKKNKKDTNKEHPGYSPKKQLLYRIVSHIHVIHPWRQNVITKQPFYHYPILCFKFQSMTVTVILFIVLLISITRSIHRSQPSQRRTTSQSQLAEIQSLGNIIFLVGRCFQQEQLYRTLKLIMSLSVRDLVAGELQPSKELEQLEIKRKCILMKNKWLDKIKELDTEISVSLSRAKKYDESIELLAFIAISKSFIFLCGGGGPAYHCQSKQLKHIVHACHTEVGKLIEVQV